MKEQELVIHTLATYNASRLLACDIVDGKTFRRMKRKGLIV
jgi:hypothetical protein